DRRCRLHPPARRPGDRDEVRHDRAEPADRGVPQDRRSPVEALNHALREIPEDRIRYHLCWGSWHGPHTHDIPLRDIVDLVLKVKAEAYSVEAGNPRHEHEWKVWQDVKLPDGKILIPGVVGHSGDFIEHPDARPAGL